MRKTNKWAWAALAAIAAAAAFSYGLAAERPVAEPMQARDDGLADDGDPVNPPIIDDPEPVGFTPTPALQAVLTHAPDIPGATAQSTVILSARVYEDGGLSIIEAPWRPVYTAESWCDDDEAGRQELRDVSEESCQDAGQGSGPTEFNRVTAANGDIVISGECETGRTWLGICSKPADDEDEDES